MDVVIASSPLTLIVNGERVEIVSADLAETLAAFDYADALVATAVDGEFAPKREPQETPVREGDRIEIPAPRRGG